MAEQEEKEPDPLADYDGPWIETRIEYFSPRKQSVELFGSWNRFKGGEELEYQGQNTYAIVTKLPLGNYVYRFLVDSEDWETNDDVAKTIKDGVEYNTVSIRGTYIVPCSWLTYTSDFGLVQKMTTNQRRRKMTTRKKKRLAMERGTKISYTTRKLVDLWLEKGRRIRLFFRFLLHFL